MEINQRKKTTNPKQKTTRRHQTMNDETEKRGWWSVKFEITLDGEDDVRLEDLTESTQEHICNSISEGFTSGEINEMH